jgi:hypothetical protein
MRKDKSKSFANHELVTLAIFLLGGETKPADLEDIAIKVNELAPGRFAWRKYPAQINIKSVDDSLRDAKKPKNGIYVLKSTKDEWLLTQKGLAFAQERIQVLQGVNVSRKPMAVKERNWLRRERERMLASDAFAKFSSGRESEISVQEAESFFRVDAYVTGGARDEKLLRTKNSFGDDLELGPLVKLLELKIIKRRNQ